MGTAELDSCFDPLTDEVQGVLTLARVAVLRRDRATLEELLHPEYICIYPDGRVFRREERIRLALAGPSQPVSLTLHDSGNTIVRLFGDTAVVTETIRQSGSGSAPGAIDEWIATSVLYRQSGRWLIVSAQLTSVRRK